MHQTDSNKKTVSESLTVFVFVYKETLSFEPSGSEFFFTCVGNFITHFVFGRDFDFSADYLLFSVTANFY